MSGITGDNDVSHRGMFYGQGVVSSFRQGSYILIALSDIG